MTLVRDPSKAIGTGYSVPLPYAEWINVDVAARFLRVGPKGRRSVTRLFNCGAYSYGHNSNSAQNGPIDESIRIL